MRWLVAVAGSVAMVGLAGCHSAFVEATVVNRTDKVIPLIEVDYPSASFGTENLAPGAQYHYRFKVLGEGEMKVIYTDFAQKEHTVKGPELREGAEGPLGIAIVAGGVEWSAQSLKSRK